MGTSKNWAGNYSYLAKTIHRPETVEQIQEIVSKSSKVKALGSRHSFNDIADSPEDIISMENLGQVVGIDADALTVTIQGGVRYGGLGQYLQAQGFALHNLASLPHISVAGACATGTHGSGNGSGNLSTAVRSIEFVTANGELARLSRDKDREGFPGAVVSLGALGIVTQLTLEIEPTYQVEQQVIDRLPFTSVESHFEEIEASGYSVSLFTDWQTDALNMVWVKRKVMGISNTPLPDPFFGAKAANEPRNPIAGMPTINATDQLGVPGPWNDRLPHFKMEFTPSSGEELQTEYFVDRREIVDALRAVSRLASRIAPLIYVCEIRTIATDDLWLSPAYHRDSVAIHFTWKQDWEAVRQLLPAIEAELAPFNPRPHWGKLFTIPAETIANSYERLEDFKALIKEFDPEGKFRNPFLDRVLCQP
jgi:xylitol oxidase